MQLIWELKPATIIEVGSKYGGSAVLWADLLRVYQLPGSRVVSIDLHPPRPYCQPESVDFIKGDEAALDEIKIWPLLPHPWLVINDASHQPWLMLPGLKFLDGFMERGDWLVVEDGWITAMGIDGSRKGGPAAAIEEFLLACPGWQIQRRYCDFYGKNVTANPNGWLKKL
jgi:cephalosporin hydroxylase